MYSELNKRLRSINFILFQFIRVKSGTNVSEIKDYMVKEWGMTRPDLLISVTGGAEPMSLKSGLRNAFRRGLMKAAESTSKFELRFKIFAYN